MIRVKKFLLLLVGLMMYLSTPVCAHKWEWAAYVSESTSIYIDTDSAVSVQELFALNEPCIQALFKMKDYVLVMNFRIYNGTLYFAPSYVEPAVVRLLNTSEAQERENRYLELRSQGASPGQANRILNRERGTIRDRLWRQYTDAIVTYGKHSDGSINPVGAFLLCKMAPLNVQGTLSLARAFGLNADYQTAGSLHMNLYKATFRALANNMN